MNEWAEFRNKIKRRIIRVIGKITLIREGRYQLVEKTGQAWNVSSYSFVKRWFQKK